MSTEIGTIHNAGSRKVDIKITRYFGGLVGTCFQLTAMQENGEWGYVQLSRADLAALVSIIDLEMSGADFTLGDP